MKVLFFALLVMMIAFGASAQTILKPKPLSSWQIGTSTIDFNDTSVFAPRQQQSFFLGWQWAGPNLATNERLKCNFYQENYGIAIRQRYYPQIPRTGSMNYVVQVGLILNGDSTEILYLHGRGLQFDPVAPMSIDTNEPLIANDTTRAVFGFANRRLGVFSAFPVADFDRYNLTTESIVGGSSATGEMVVDNPVILDRYEVSLDESDDTL